MLTKKAKYGLIALIALGKRATGEPMLIADLARQEGIPLKYLESILLELKKHGVVASRKGRGGGYALARDPADVPVSKVLRVLEGPLALTPCVSEMAWRQCDECRDMETCAIRVTMGEVRSAVVKILDGTSLADVIARSVRLEAEKAARPARRARKSAT